MREILGCHPNRNLETALHQYRTLFGELWQQPSAFAFRLLDAFESQHRYHLGWRMPTSPLACRVYRLLLQLPTRGLLYSHRNSSTGRRNKLRCLVRLANTQLQTRRPQHSNQRFDGRVTFG